MKTVPLSEAKDKLSALVEEADKTHEIIQITRHGHPSAVLMSADDLESLQETIHWLSQPGIREDLEQSKRDIQEGNMVSGDDIRREFRLPPR
ncbi:prevent-host-death family protein [Arthrobacter pigmenti]|uniref:Antitoxin n=1 Tax=Arthrobacter pigmenti TaxID=271432 RepID=A0A846RLY5_9MICC|nr:type II toxin-antitoxin system Phd/YefM family antitoxin [Arthrobacter pigmenti]NJC24243.1 prevent-host-death family protein [Arthrobacter pigmenti]